MAHLWPCSVAGGVAAQRNGEQEALEEHPPVVGDGPAGGALPCNTAKAASIGLGEEDSGKQCDPM